MTMGWKLYDKTKIKGLDASRLFSDEKVVIVFKDKEYVGKFFIDIMISIPKKKITKFGSWWWGASNKLSYIYGGFYRILPHYGRFGKKVKRIYPIINFSLFIIRIVIFIFTIWIPYYVMWKTNHAGNKNAEKVAMYYNYNNKGLIYDTTKINTKLKFRDTEVFVNDDWEKELELWFGKTWTEFPPEYKQKPHHIVLTPNIEKLAKKYKISPFIVK